MIESPKPAAFVLLFCLGICLTVAGQEDFLDNRSKYLLRAQRAPSEIVVDGRLDERTWEVADRAKDFFRVLPIDSGQAVSQTEVMMAYDDQHLYMAIICHDTFPGKRPAESLRRDFSFGKNDNFLAFIDTYNDQTNGFSFGISAAGAQWDGIQANGGFVSLNWDCKWTSAVVNDPTRWVAEFAIPFRSIRYQDGVKEWGINFSRLDLKSAEKSSWAPVPRQFQTANLAFTGTLRFDEPPPRLGTRFSLIPSLTARTSRDFASGRDRTWDLEPGLDAKVTLSTSLNLDVTANPDFSQVEVDRQITNLDRFELFFPERRQFFLENSDLFSSLGTDNIRPFFSRRIGLDSPVRAGMRLSGKLTEDLRVGLMNMQTGRQGDRPAANFTVAALQKKVFSRSNLGVFLVNKNLTGDYIDDDGHRYNRIVGVDYNLASADSRWTGKAFYHQSLYPGAAGESMAWATQLTFNNQLWEITYDQSFVGSDYLAEVGFVNRRGFFQMKPSIGRKFFPAQSKSIASHGLTASATLIYDTDLALTDRIAALSYGWQWLDRSSLSIRATNNFLRLNRPFDPTNLHGEQLPAGSRHDWTDVSMTYASNSRDLLTYGAAVTYGGYFNGNRLALEGEGNYRVQPYANLGLVAAYNRIRLPSPYNDADFVLLGPRLDLTFSEKIFLTIFSQYNSQIDNLNVNIRFQWRYAPVSDFFIVYTDNSDPRARFVKNRALVAKISYYLN